MPVASLAVVIPDETGGATSLVQSCQLPFARVRE
jgi:hypothetical protein